MHVKTRPHCLPTCAMHHKMASLSLLGQLLTCASAWMGMARRLGSGLSHSADAPRGTALASPAFFCSTLRRTATGQRVRGCLCQSVFESGSLVAVGCAKGPTKATPCHCPYAAVKDCAGPGASADCLNCEARITQVGSLTVLPGVCIDVDDSENESKSESGQLG